MLCTDVTECYFTTSVYHGLQCSLAHIICNRALIRSMGEILFSCGSGKTAVIATLNVFNHDIDESENNMDDEVG